MEFREWMTNNTNLMYRSIRLYSWVIDYFNKTAEDDSIEEINKFLANITRDKRLSYVKSAFKQYLTFKGRVSEYKDIIKIKQRANKSIGCYLSVDEIERIVNKMRDKRYRMVALIQFITGARAHDVLGFMRSNIVYNDGILLMKLYPKGEKKEYIVFIPKKYSAEVKNFMEKSKSEYPFLTNVYGSMTAAIDRNYIYYWKVLKESARYCSHPEFSSHDFRRNFAEDLYEKEKDIRKVRDILGHSSVMYTIRYIDGNLKTAEKERINLSEKIRG